MPAAEPGRLDDRAAFAQALSAARHEANESVGEVADRAGVFPQTLAAWEQGTRHPPPHLYLRLLSALPALGTWADERALQVGPSGTRTAIRTAAGWTPTEVASGKSITITMLLGPSQ